MQSKWVYFWVLSKWDHQFRIQTSPKSGFFKQDIKSNFSHSWYLQIRTFQASQKKLVTSTNQKDKIMSMPAFVNSTQKLTWAHSERRPPTEPFGCDCCRWLLPGWWPKPFHHYARGNGTGQSWSDLCLCWVLEQDTNNGQLRTAAAFL